MFDKRLMVIMSMILTVFLAGCGHDRIVVDNPLSEQEIIELVQEKVYEESGDRVTAEIVSKEQLKKAIMGIDGPFGYQTVEGGTEYELKITNNDDKNIVSKAYYKDGYIIYDKNYPNGTKEESYFGSNYISDRGFFRVKYAFTYALDTRFDEYYIFNDVSDIHGLDIFICSSDYEVIKDLLSDLEYTVTRYRDEEFVAYSVYIYKDEQIFNKDFEKFEEGHEDFGGHSLGEDMISQYTGKQAVTLSNCRYFDQAFFESDGAENAYKIIDDTDPKSFDYLVYYYNASPNSFVGANNPFTTIYGVR